MHGVFEMVFNGRFVFPPLNRLRRVLDCGYGCASWACAVAEQHPGAEVGFPIIFRHKLKEALSAFML